VVGFLRLPADYSVSQALYRTARLFTINLDVPEGITPVWELWVAAVAAPLATFGVLVRLLHARAQALLTSRLLANHIVVCGMGVRGRRLAEALGRDGGLVVAVDVKEDVRGPRGWWAIGDATHEVVLRRAGVHRAREVIIVTGNDLTNGSIAAATHRLVDGRRGPTLHVHLDDPGLARVVASAADGQVSLLPFSTAALAAVAGVDMLTVGRGADSAVRPMAGVRASLVLVGDDDPVIDALILELHRRWQTYRLAGSSYADRPLVTLVGSAAAARLRHLRRRYGSPFDELELAAYDLDALLGSELEPDAVRFLRSCEPIRFGWVVDRGQGLHGLRQATAIARAIGPGPRLLLVHEQTGHALMQDVQRESAAHPAMAEVLSAHAVDLAFPTTIDSMLLHEQGRSARLARALYGRAPTSEQRHEAEALVAEHAGAIDDDPAPEPARWESAALRGLRLPSAEILTRASLRVELTPDLLERAGPHVLAADPDWAFEVYARVVRCVHDIDQVDTIVDVVESVEVEPGTKAQVLRLLHLRRRFLGGDKGETPDGGHDQFAVLGGGARSWDVAHSEWRPLVSEMLVVALDHPRWPGTLISGGTDSGLPGAVGDVQGVSKRGALPATDGGREVARYESGYDGFDQDGDGFSIDDALRVWHWLLERRVDPRRVPVLLFPGGSITRQELLLAVALDAEVAVVDLTRDRGPSDLLEPMDARVSGVLVLPADAMVIRAFLRSTAEVPLSEEVIEALAERVHDAYRRSQRRTRHSDDPAMQPWSRLSPTLRASNRAQVAYIPALLAAAGLRVVGRDRGCPLVLEGVTESHPSSIPLPQPWENMARMEHGRWVVERLRQGWELGDRRPARLVSPYLVGWDELDETTKEWDRDVIRGLPELLEAMDLGVAE
jgi:voltage-gated potassium channel Kch